MELIMINDSKLKIMLTEEDMQRFALDCSSVNYDNTETRRAFWSILDEAKHQTGFDAASDRVFIQLYPSKEGGCEMYVTKVGLLCASARRQALKSSVLIGSGNTAPKPLVFAFDSLGTMISACRLTRTRESSWQSTAWMDEMGICYLFAFPESDDESEFLSGIMSEFGGPVDTDKINTYIKEHGKEICAEHAFETLSVL